MPDPELGFRYVPYARGRVAGHFEIDNDVEINSLGFYDEEPLPPGQSDLRVLAVGDSFTANMNVPRAEVWTAVAERWLRAHGHPRADVINLALDGTGSDVHVRILERFVPRLRPQVVVLAFFGNDFDDVQNGRFVRECHRGFVLSYQTDAQRAGLRARADEVAAGRWRRWLWDRLYLGRLVARVSRGPANAWRLNFLQPRRTELGLDDAVIESRRPWIAAALDALEDVARRCDCIFLVAPVPPRASLAGSLRLFRAQAGARELRVVSVLPAIRAALERDGLASDALYFVHDNHLNPYGSRLYGEAVAAAIDRALRWRPPDEQTGPPRPPAATAPRRRPGRRSSSSPKPRIGSERPQDLHRPLLGAGGRGLGFRRGSCHFGCRAATSAGCSFAPRGEAAWRSGTVSSPTAIST